MKKIRGLVAFVAYLAASFAVFWNLPETWKDYWGWYGPPLGVLGWCVLAQWFGIAEYFVSKKELKRRALKDSVNPPFRQLK